ncbi:MAG: diaminopimelate epimerase [Chlamydiales bacterium]|nr:diaminopimelate epimerase [Chlamydiales bacterium]
MPTKTEQNTLLIPVSHYSGCGNDFILMDNREGLIPELTGACVNQICQPAGVDGLIVAMNSKSADVAMKYYNCDGTEAEMCGNGVRCLMQFLRQKRSYPKDRCLLETKLRDLIVTSDHTDISVQMGCVHDYEWDIPLEFEGKKYTAHHLNTGVPHVVIFCDNVADIDVEKVGRHFRNHEKFAPQGANINFVQIIAHHEQFTACVRTYERGVERETLACGTGVTAAARCLHKQNNFQSPISLRVQSGQWLQVFFEENNSKFENVILKGPATWVRDGKLDLDPSNLQFTLQFS